MGDGPARPVIEISENPEIMTGSENRPSKRAARPPCVLPKRARGARHKASEGGRIVKGRPCYLMIAAGRGAI